MSGQAEKNGLNDETAGFYEILRRIPRVRRKRRRKAARVTVSLSLSLLFFLYFRPKYLLSV